jgi:hypothetical protein
MRSFLIFLSLVAFATPQAPQPSQTCSYNCHPTDEYNVELGTQSTVGTNLYCYYPSLENPLAFCQYSATVCTSIFISVHI